MTVYIDEVFVLNALTDYLLLLCAARMTGQPVRRRRLALSAGLGGAYAAACCLPGWEILAHPAWVVGAGTALVLTAFGACRHLARAALAFFGASAALAGGVLALEGLLGGSAVPDLKLLLLAAAGCYALLSVPFRRVARHGRGEVARAELELGGRRCVLDALVDTGNTLADPVTGAPVLVAEGERLRELFPPGAAPGAEDLADPVLALERHRGEGVAWRLLPYRAVGVEHALLLAVKVDAARIGGEDRGAVLVALSPTPVSDGGGYSALIGA